jgi:alpha-methylacyl-CoA racemase
MAGPLAGFTVVEISGIGAVPFGGMLLADMGARVIRIDPPAPSAQAGKIAESDLMRRGRESIVLDLKNPDGLNTALSIVEACDAAVEGWRPGVAERLGIGPEECHRRNPKLTYARLTGWGQDGPYAHLAGHDLNYIAISGALSAITAAGERPRPPLNLLGDFAGGGMLMAFGLVCGILEARTSGTGQVIDVSMVDGSALLLAMDYSMANAGRTVERSSMREGSWYYNTYETSDGRFISVAAYEPSFRAELTDVLTRSSDGDFSPEVLERAEADVVDLVRRVVKRKTLQEWTSAFEGHDACFAPVVGSDGTDSDGHLSYRRTYTTDVTGTRQPAPAPRFSRTPAELRKLPPRPGADTDAVLRSIGFTDERIATLQRRGAFG